METNEVEVELTDKQNTRLLTTLGDFARKEKLVPDGAINIGITTRWGHDKPILVFDVKG